MYLFSMGKKLDGLLNRTVLSIKNIKEKETEYNRPFSLMTIKIDIKSIGSVLNIESLVQRFLQWNLHDFQQ